VSFASSIGATLAFLASRFVLRDWVQARFGAKLKPINDGVAREGAFYLFALRLVPAFPFFVINLVMGLTPIRAWTFYWVSQLGMLAGTVVYVYAGTQLGEFRLSPGWWPPSRCSDCSRSRRRRRSRRSRRAASTRAGSSRSRGSSTATWW
jgi:uncharacterized membrane protein YdjX (TVP38/TMEM64 family)